MMARQRNEKKLITASEEKIETAPLKHFNWRKLIKWFAISTGSLIGFVCLMVLGLYFFISSSEFSLQSVSRITPYIEPLGIKINRLDSAKIDPLQAVSIRGLSVEWQDEKTGNALFEAEEFRISYTLSELFDNRFQLDELLLNKAKLTARLKPQESKPEPDEDKTEQALDLEKLEKLLSSPPLDVHVKNIQLTDIDLDIIAELPQQKFVYRGQLKNLAVNVLWTSQQLKSAVHLDMTETPDTTLQLFIDDESFTPASVLQAYITPALLFDLELKISNDQRNWQLETATLKNQVYLRNIAISKSSEGETKTVGGVKEISFEVNSLLKSENNSKTDSAIGNGLSSLFPIILKTKVDTSTSELNITELEQNDLRLSANADHKLQLGVNGKVLSLDKLQPMLEIALSNDLLLPNLQVEMPGQKALIKDFSSNLTLNGSAPVDTSKDSPLVFDLNFNTRLSSLDFDQAATKIDDQTSTEAINATLQPEFTLTASGELASLVNPLETLLVSFKPALVINSLKAQLGEGKAKKLYAMSQQSFMGQGEFVHGVLDFDGDLNLEKVDIPEIEKTFSLLNHFDLAADVALKDTQVKISTRLDDVASFDVDMQLQNPENELSIIHDIKAQVSPALVNYLPAAAELKKLGKLKVSLNGTSSVQHRQSAIQNADITLLLDWPLLTKGEITLTQLSKPKVKEGVFLTGPLTVNYDIDKSKFYKTSLNINSAGIKTPPLKVALPLSVDLKNEFTWPLSITKGEGNILIASEPALSYWFSVDDKPKNLALQTTMTVNANPDWVKYIEDLQVLDQLGQIKTDLKLKVKLKHDKTTILELDPEKPEKLKLDLALDTDVQQAASRRGTLLHINKPVKLKQELKWQAEAIKWDLDYVIGDLLLPEQLSVENLQGALSFSGGSGLKPNNGRVTLTNPRGNLRLLAEDKADELELGSVLFPLNLDMSAAMIEEQINLDNFALDIGAKLVQITAKGSASIDGKNAQLESQVSTMLREEFFPGKQMSGSGSMNVPLNLIMVDGEQVSIDGELLFNQFALSSPEFAVKGLHGKIKLEEELLISPGKIDFRYLIQHDPFQRVDFTRIQPYLDNPALQMESLTVADMTLGPMLSIMQLKQNIFQLQRLDLELFGGHLTGQFYLDASPGGWKIGLLSRISQLDPRQLLKADAQQKAGIYSPVSVRTAIDFDVHKRLLQGRIDISEISREQLLQLLEVVDPKHEDEQLAHVRTALQLAYPEGVSVVMKQGLMDLSVELSALPKPIEVKGLPLTPLIQVFAGDILTELDKLASQQKDTDENQQEPAEEQR